LNRLKINVDEQYETLQNVFMSAKSKKKPTPDELLLEVKGQKAAKTYEFDDYLPVVDELQKKDYSYAQIAEFLETRLGIKVSRGQVYRAYQMWLEAMEEVELQQREEAELAMETEYEGPEPQDLQEAAFSNAVGDVLKYVHDKYPDSSLSGGRLALLKRCVGILDYENRDEHEAEEADRQKELRKQNSHDAPGK
jgi:hypothetical protein